MVTIEHVENSVNFVDESSQRNIKNIRSITTKHFVLGSYFRTWPFNGSEKC